MESSKNGRWTIPLFKKFSRLKVNNWINFIFFQVLSKFNREGKGFVDFLDFVTYIPLFIDIHKRIIQDPFNDNLDV